MPSLNLSVNYGLAAGGVVTAGLFSYAVFSPQHSMAFKLTFLAGAAFFVLAQALIRNFKVSQEEKDLIESIPFAFSYLCPLGAAINHAIQSILRKILPESLHRQPSAIQLNMCAGLILGIAVTNLIFNSYDFFRSRQAVK